jgi:hypothetical protein
LDAAYKIFTDILASIELDLLQDRSTNGHTFTTKQIIQKSREYNITFHQLYIEFKEAFDCVGRSPILEAKKKFCAPAILISLTKYTFSRTYKKVKIQTKLSGTFRTELILDKEISYPHLCLILVNIK